MKGKSCGNCQYCIQYFTGDNYYEFGCKQNRELKCDHMGYPSYNDCCDIWENNIRGNWVE